MNGLSLSANWHLMGRRAPLETPGLEELEPV